MNSKLFLFITISLLFSSCALKPVKSEYSLLRSLNEPVLLNELDNGKILIYNGASSLYKAENTASLNIWINNRALGQLKANEYAIIYLLPGKYDFKIQHKDIKTFENTKTIDVDFSTKIICVKPTITSNKITIENDIPSNFDGFNNIAL